MDGFPLMRDNCSYGPCCLYNGYICSLFFTDGGHWCQTNIKTGFRSSCHTADIFESRIFPQHSWLWNHKLTSVICTQLWLLRLMSAECVFQTFQTQVKDDARVWKRKTKWINEWGPESCQTGDKDLIKSSKLLLLYSYWWHNFLYLLKKNLADAPK